MAKKTLTQSTVATNNIQSQPDQVKDQAAALKLAFDQYGIDSKTYNNGTLLVELQSETLNDSGAHAIGLKTPNSVADNVADEIDLIRQAGSGSIPPDDSITLAKQNLTVKTGLLADLNTTNKTTFKDAINEVDLNTDRNTDAIQYSNTVAGTDVLTITTPTGDFTFAVGKVVRGVAVNNNTGAMTANVDTDGALPIKTLDGSSYVDVEADAFEDNKPFELICQNDGVIGDFFLQAPKGGASWIKSIQHGSGLANNTTNTFTLGTTLDDFNYAVVLINFSGNTSNIYEFDTTFLKAKCISNTQLETEKFADESDDLVFGYTVIEVDPSAVEQFVFDETVFSPPGSAGDSFDVTFPTVDLSKTLVFGNYMNARSVALSTYNFAWYYRILSSTAVRWQAIDTSAGQGVETNTWIIELK